MTKKIIIFDILSVESHGIKYIHIIMQPPSPSISRNFSPSQCKIQYL